MSGHARLKAQLEKKLSELLERASEIEDGLSSPGSTDWEDHATESEDDEVMASLGDLTRSEIHEIRLALSRIESGHYGTCVGCGQPIATERLAALPFATTCIRCA